MWYPIHPIIPGSGDFVAVITPIAVPQNPPLPIGGNPLNGPFPMKSRAGCHARVSRGITAPVLEIRFALRAPDFEA
jgi:hypothetical protein